MPSNQHAIRQIEYKRESDLAKPVAEWLRAEGYTVYSEVAFGHRCIDMVGLLGLDTLRTVELKLRFGMPGVKQAMLCQLITNDVYLAVGNAPQQSSVELCKKYGVGLLGIGDTVEVLSMPDQVIQPDLLYKRIVIEDCLIAGPSDIAGLPSMGGNGPARFVGKLVKEYVRQHPNAQWQEIYVKVPNHYSNYRSMAAAMASYLGLSLTKIKNEFDRI